MLIIVLLAVPVKCAKYMLQLWVTDHGQLEHVFFKRPTLYYDTESMVQVDIGRLLFTCEETTSMTILLEVVLVVRD